LPVSLSSIPRSRLLFDPSDPHVEKLSSVLSVETQVKALARFGIAGRVWYRSTPLFRGRLTSTGMTPREAARAMMLHVRNPDANEFNPRFGFEGMWRCMEPGAGIASLAIAAVHPHARVVLTDLLEVFPLLQSNAQGYPGVKVRPVAWGCVARSQALRRAGSHASHTCHLQLSGVCCPSSPRPDEACKENDAIGVFPRFVGTAAELVATSRRSKHNVRNSSGSFPQDPVAVQGETSFWSAFGLWFMFASILVQARSEIDSR
jgi:hypothetical protein